MGQALFSSGPKARVFSTIWLELKPLSPIRADRSGTFQLRAQSTRFTAAFQTIMIHILFKTSRYESSKFLVRGVGTALKEVLIFVDTCSR